MTHRMTTWFGVLAMIPLAACTALSPAESTLTPLLPTAVISTVAAPTSTPAGDGQIATPTAPPPLETPATGFVPASISGRVWHDLCATGAEGQPPLTVVSPGCVVDTAGAHRANGLLEDGEPLIDGVRLTLGVGACPSTGLAEAYTTASGAGYQFAGLNAGTYCVSIDPQSGPNRSLLLPGGWTYPTPVDGPASATITVKAGEARTDVNFGWDYQFLPAISGTVGQCTYAAAFLGDVTVPDGTVFAPGTPFIKTWRVRNDGTCTWGPDHGLGTLAFVGGSPLGGPEGVELPSLVQPGQTVDLSVAMTAPARPGNYLSEWKLAIAGGSLLGVGSNGAPLYAAIVVAPGTPAPTPTSARITFASGAISSAVQGTLTFPQRNTYVLRALKGQQMTVEIISKDNRANFAVQGLSDGPPLKRLENEDRRWTGTLPGTQDYLLTVAVPEGAAAYTVTITIVTP